MPKTVVDFPVFDADNHMYETTDAFTKFLPKEYDGLIKYVQVNGRTKIAVRNVISGALSSAGEEQIRICVSVPVGDVALEL